MKLCTLHKQFGFLFVFLFLVFFINIDNLHTCKPRIDCTSVRLENDSPEVRFSLPKHLRTIIPRYITYTIIYWKYVFRFLFIASVRSWEAQHWDECELAAVRE